MLYGAAKIVYVKGLPGKLVSYLTKLQGPKKIRNTECFLKPYKHQPSATNPSKYLKSPPSDLTKEH